MTSCQVNIVFGLTNDLQTRKQTEKKKNIFAGRLVT